jgi:hydroxymethylbilane synthase
MTMSRGTIAIGTRGSTLAMWQAHHVKKLLEAREPGLRVEVVPIKTTGDIIQDVALARLEGKAFFTKEIEDALLGNEVDLAVHSGKDVPTDQPEGLSVTGFIKRHTPFDAWVSRDGSCFDALPAGATVGTSSLRRRALIAHLRPDLAIEELRGNVDTRLRKLAEGQYDAIVLAAAGLERLGKSELITELMPAKRFPSAVAQGAIALETRSDDKEVNAIVDQIVDGITTQAVLAERALLRTLEGGCQVPLGALATVDDGRLTIVASLLSPDGSRRIDAQLVGDPGDAVAVGVSLAESLVGQGGGELLQMIRR